MTARNTITVVACVVCSVWPGLFLGKFGRSQLPQLLVNQRKQLVCSRLITVLNLRQDTSNIAHARIVGVSLCRCKQTHHRPLS
jgi:hypothetical protein